jgi:exopolysaccharide biosynthesis polyprenyl glycosylphosphotransferase
MPSLLLNPEQQKPRKHDDDWARLIPGELPAFRDPGKRPSQPVRAGTGNKVSQITSAKPAAHAPQEHALALLLPRPLQTRTAWAWLCSTAADFAMVGLNWLFLGAVLVPIRQTYPQIAFGFDSGAPLSLLGIALLHAALITLQGYSEGMYSATDDFRRQARILGKSVLLATVILAFACGLLTTWATSALICAAGFLHFGALLTWRWQSLRQRAENASQSNVRRVLIVGAGAVGRRVASSVEKHPAAGREVCGFLDDEAPLGERVIGRVSDLAPLARTKFVDEVILAPPQRKDLTLQVLQEARSLHLDVEIVPELFGCTPAENEVEHVGDIPVICLHAERLPAASLALKRLVDIAGAGLALTALSPMLAAIAALIKLDSAGPVLYTAQRAGHKGRLFRCFKFRTMVNNADQLKKDLRQSNQRSGPFFKIAADPRITRLGSFLRRYSLDELPQFWNVLKGDMSLVGPRPHPLDDVAAYGIEHLARLDVTPGITGLWQVTARRDPSFQRGMDLDREYIRTWSLGMDLRILLKTLLAVAKGSGD